MIKFKVNYTGLCIEHYECFPEYLSKESDQLLSSKKVLRVDDSSWACSAAILTVFEESSAGEEPFENLFDENNFDEVQDALENLIDICVILIYL